MTRGFPHRHSKEFDYLQTVEQLNYQSRGFGCQGPKIAAAAGIEGFSKVVICHGIESIEHRADRQKSESLPIKAGRAFQPAQVKMVFSLYRLASTPRQAGPKPRDPLARTRNPMQLLPKLEKSSILQFVSLQRKVSTLVLRSESTVGWSFYQINPAVRQGHLPSSRIRCRRSRFSRPSELASAW